MIVLCILVQRMNLLTFKYPATVQETFPLMLRGPLNYIYLNLLRILQ